MYDYVDETYNFTSEGFNFIHNGSFFAGNYNNFLFTFDDTEYDMTWTYYDSNSMSYYAGNLSLRSDTYEDTGEPFCLWGSYEGLNIKVKTLGEHYIKWSGKKINIKTIDLKYLPDTVATLADIEAAIGTAIGGSY